MSLNELKGVCLHVLKDNYVNFEGRATRYEFWWFYVISLCLSVLATIGDQICGIAICSGLLSLALLLPQLSLCARRLHDINRSGWWQLLLFIPLIGWIVLIVWFVQKSDESANDFGEPSTFPAENQAAAAAQE